MTQVSHHYFHFRINITYNYFYCTQLYIQPLPSSSKNSLRTSKVPSVILYQKIMHPTLFVYVDKFRLCPVINKFYIPSLSLSLLILPLAQILSFAARSSTHTNAIAHIYIYPSPRDKSQICYDTHSYFSI